METTNAHTAGKLTVTADHPKKGNDRYLETELGSRIGRIYLDGPEDEEGKQNANRIVTAWNTIDQCETLLKKVHDGLSTMSPGAPILLEIEHLLMDLSTK